MMGATTLPIWTTLLVALLIVAGAGLTLTGSIGLLRLPSFFQRIHAPTLGTTLGAGTTLIGSMLFFTAATSTPVVGEVLIAVFLTLTTPISFIVLATATRQRAEPPLSSELPQRREDE